MCSDIKVYQIAFDIRGNRYLAFPFILVVDGPNSEFVLKVLRLKEMEKDANKTGKKVFCYSLFSNFID